MGEMEQRLARGELPTIPIPETPVHMKTNVKTTAPKQVMSGNESDQGPPVILLKKPKRLDPAEIKARKSSAEEAKKGRMTPSGVQSPKQAQGMSPKHSQARGGAMGKGQG